jgi:hypothetical protein
MWAKFLQHLKETIFDDFTPAVLTLIPTASKPKLNSRLKRATTIPHPVQHCEVRGGGVCFLCNPEDLLN